MPILASGPITAQFGRRVFQRALTDDRLKAILLQSLADRLAEAFAEFMHHRVRTDLWGYVPDEDLSNHDMIQEAYRGIRPAPGYPVCPEHAVKLDMFRLLQCDEIGMHVTEAVRCRPARRCRVFTSVIRSRSISRSARSAWTR